MFYTEDKGHRWATQAVQHETLEAAHHEAARSSHDCFETRVYDCSGGPVGVLVAVYRNGVSRMEGSKS